VGLCDQLSRIEVSPLRGAVAAAPAHDTGVTVNPELIEHLLADAASGRWLQSPAAPVGIVLGDRRTEQADSAVATASAVRRRRISPVVACSGTA
jgi:hypothetical protein